MRALLLVGVVACASGHTRDLGRQSLLEASGNAGALEKMLHGSVVNGGLWFANPQCVAQFPEAGDVPADHLGTFARCLAELHLQASARKDALGDVVVMTYAPGFEVEARVVDEESGPRLMWIGYEARRSLSDNLPTITPEAFEALRTSGDRNGPIDPSVAAGLELDEIPASHAAFSWLKVCIDANGAVTAARPFETTSTKASSAFTDAAAGWQFHPFTIGGQALPVCSMVRMAYPPSQGPVIETIPLPPPPSKGKHEPIMFANGALNKFTESKRISGTRAIEPDNPTKIAIYKADVEVVKGSFRLCLDDTGHVESVLPMRSTGFADYDRKLMVGLSHWVYSPYLIDDQPVPVCTAINFFYRQH